MSFVLPMGCGIGVSIFGAVITSVFGFKSISASVFFPLGVVFCGLLFVSFFVDNSNENQHNKKLESRHGRCIKMEAGA